MRWVALLVVSACGRIGFDPLADDDAQSVFDQIALVPGGDADGVLVASDAIYAWFDDRGAFRSDDGGVRWVECERKTALHLAEMPGGQIVLASADDVYASTDRCAHWTPTRLGIETRELHPLTGRLLAGTVAGLRSLDNTGWSTVATPFEGHAIDAIASDPTGQTILIGSDLGIARSTNAGGTWNVQNGGLENLRVVALAIAPSSPTRAYAVEESGGPTTGAAFRSNDGGATWSEVFGNGGEQHALAIDPTDPDRVLFANYNELAVTENGGANWSDGRAPEMDLAHFHSFAFDPTGGLWTAGGRGVFRGTFPGPTWVERNGAIDAWEIEDIARLGSSIFLSTSSGVMRSTGGAQFELVSKGSDLDSVSHTVMITPDDKILQAGGRFVRLSTDGGASYTTAFDVDAPNNYTTHALAHSADRVFVATAAQIAYADPPWTSWTNVSLDGSPHEVRDVIARPNGSVVAASEDGVFASMDDGQTFSELAGAPPDARCVVDAGSALLLGTSDGVWIYDGSWRRAGLGGVFVADLMVADDRWLAATLGGVRISHDAGATWETVPGLDDRFPFHFGIDDDGSLLVGTKGSGLYRTAMPN